MVGGASFDASGRIDVSGYAYNGPLDGKPSASGGGTFVTQYNAALALQWTSVVNPVSGALTAPAPTLAVDSARSRIYVTSSPNGVYASGGSHLDGTGTDAALIQLDFQGGFLWATQDGPASGNVFAQAYGVVVDASGNPYLLGATQAGMHGNTQHNISNGYDYFVSRYDSTGQRIWTIQDGIAGTNSLFYIFGSGIGIDGGGNIYISGGDQATPGGPGMDANVETGPIDLFVTQYNGTGQRI